MPKGLNDRFEREIKCLSPPFICARFYSGVDLQNGAWVGYISINGRYL